MGGQTTGIGRTVNSPFFSVIVASKNSVKTMRRLINSFSAQTYPHKELIIADGISTDGTLDVLKQETSRITHWASEPDTGIYQAWNKALSRAKGDWICFFGADDYFWTPTALEQMAEHLKDAQPQYRVVYGRVAVVSSQGHVLQMVGEPWEKVSELFLHEFSIPHQGILHHKSLFEEHGKFDESFKISGDYDLLLRELKSRPAKFVPDVVVTAMQIGGISSMLENTPVILSELRRARTNNGLPDFSVPLAKREMLNKTRQRLNRFFGSRLTDILADGYRVLTGKSRLWTKQR